jgi:hypothetical protein
MTNEALVRIISQLEKRLDSLILPEVVGPWQDWTPTIDQGGAVTFTGTYARYAIDNDTAHMMVHLGVTSVGVAGNAVTIGSIPSHIAPAHVGARVTFGVFIISNGGVNYQGITTYTSGGFQFRDSTTRSLVGINPNIALAPGDIIDFNVTYER